MSFTNKVTRLKNGDIVDIGQYRYTFHHIVERINNKNTPARDIKYWSVIVNVEYLSNNAFNPDELPLGKVGKYSVTKFEYLYSYLGYQRLIRFNSNKIREQYKKSETMIVNHIFDGINCDILDLRDCEPSIFVKTQTREAGNARVVITDYTSLESFKGKYWCNFDNLVMNRELIVNTEEIKNKLQNIMFTEGVKVKHIDSIESLEKFISKVKMLMLDSYYLLVV